MNGYDPNWVRNNEPNKARYVRLPVGTYTFNVTAANPSITSTSVSPVVVMEQSLLTLSCTSAGPPGTVLSWYFNGTQLDPASNDSVTIGADGTLRVSSPTISYTGTYTCNVSTLQWPWRTYKSLWEVSNGLSSVSTGKTSNGGTNLCSLDVLQLDIPKFSRV